jgi:hypothetical protein
MKASWKPGCRFFIVVALPTDALVILLFVDLLMGRISAEDGADDADPVEHGWKAANSRREPQKSSSCLIRMKWNDREGTLVQ